MGIFGFNYSKPGPGVSKDAPEKKGIFRFFEMFFRKFWKLIQVNMLYFIASLPFMAIMAVLSPTDYLVELAVGAVNDDTVLFAVILRVMFAVLMLVLFGSGPASASYAYITRCFTRAEHSWIFSDFKDKFKENFKQGIIVSIVDILFVAVIVVAFRVYLVQYKSTGSTLWLIILAFLTTMTFVFTTMHFYIYQFMVTFHSTTRQLFKNACIFTIASLPMCVFLFAFAVAINFVMFMYIPSPFIVVLLDFLLGISLARFPIEYSASRAISKKLLPNIVQESNDEQVFSDDIASQQDEGEE